MACMCSLSLVPRPKNTSFGLGSSLRARTYTHRMLALALGARSYCAGRVKTVVGREIVWVGLKSCVTRWDRVSWEVWQWLFSLCAIYVLHPDMGDWRSEEADSDLVHGVEIKASLPHSASPRRLLLRFRRSARLSRLFYGDWWPKSA